MVLAAAAPSVAFNHGPLRSDELQHWLEWAGSKLLALQITSPYPRPPSAAWPIYALDPNVAYGYSSERLRPPSPTGRDIKFMDELLLWQNKINDVTTRRIVGTRLLVHPISNRYLFTWSKIAFMIHSDRRKVMRLHKSGLEELVAKVEKDKVYTIRAFLSSPS